MNCPYTCWQHSWPSDGVVFWRFVANDLQPSARPQIWHRAIKNAILCITYQFLHLKALLPLCHRCCFGEYKMKIIMTKLKTFLFVIAFMLTLHTITFSVGAEPALQQKTVGGTTYTVKLLVQDNFAN